jgi:hypothetical protein
MTPRSIPTAIRIRGIKVGIKGVPKRKFAMFRPSTPPKKAPGRSPKIAKSARPVPAPTKLNLPESFSFIFAPPNGVWNIIYVDNYSTIRTSLNVLKYIEK